MDAPTIPTAEDILSVVRTDAIAVRLYGSFARGDAVAESDVDVLVLVAERPGSEAHGRFSIVSYTESQLEALVEARSLFAWHVLSEGQEIWDPEGRIRAALERHEGPDTTTTLARVQSLSSVLDVDEAEFNRRRRGLSRVGRFLLRTATYSIAIERGTPSFNLAHAAGVLDSTGSLLDVLRGKEPLGDWSEFEVLREWLVRLVGPLEANPYGSLASLVRETRTTNPELSAVAYHALKNRSIELFYAGLDMPVL